MGSSLETGSRASREFLAAFRREGGVAGSLDFAAFVKLALYDPDVGYYTRLGRRVGYGPGTDFFTSATSGPVFGEMVSAACVQLLGERDPKAHTFVEFGAEPDRGVLDGVRHPFGDYRAIRVDEPLTLTGSVVVFSNELFDAQPFRRFVFRDGGWRELGVALHSEVLTEVELPARVTAPTDLVRGLPAAAAAGYVIDAPTGAAELADAIAGQPWSGLLVACDYGKSWRELVEATPAGTARGYFRHTQTNELLARPGKQDLTCHICWDWLSEALKRHGFKAPEVETQEAFFIHHAEAYLAPAIAADADRLTPRKRSLLQLLHGSHLGQKFQVLHALR